MDIKEQQVVDFLAKHKLCAFTTLLKDGSPHAATIHFSEMQNPTRIILLTEKTTKKCEALLEKNSVPASFVIGFSEEERMTLQMDGTVRLVTGAVELAAVKEVHFTKIPTAKKFEKNPDTVLLEFTPTWWRFTDYNGGKKILSS